VLAEEVRGRPDREHERDERSARPAESPFAQDDTPAHVRRERDQRGRDELAADPGPRLRPVNGLPAEGGSDPEEEGAESGDEEAAAKEEVEATSLDREANSREHGDDPGRERDGRVEDEPQLRQLVAVPQRRIGDEESEPGPEEAE
jgi:hypothetical protein